MFVSRRKAPLTAGWAGLADALVVFSGGNTLTHSLLYPATRPNVVAVGAIGRTGTQADYSPNNPTIVAPSAQVAQRLVAAARRAAEAPTEHIAL